MSWNPLSWFRAAEAKVEEVAISVETLALKEVDSVINFLGSSQEKLSGYRKELADDIASWNAALAKVDEQLAKLQSVVPQPTPEPAPAQAEPQP